ncbi:MAG TPA: hypothetical protein VHM25_10035 [Polyangiaceae bacterium]|nr:hypothetical protein [Polyangiaceae bacterium]
MTGAVDGLSDSLAGAIAAMNTMEFYSEEDVRAEAERLQRSLLHVDQLCPETLFDVMRLNLRARAKRLRFVGEHSGRELRISRKGPTNVIFVCFRPIDENKTVYCTYGWEWMVRDRLRKHRKAEERALLSVAPSNDGSEFREVTERWLVRFTMTRRRRDHLERFCSIVAGQWVGVPDALTAGEALDG